MILVIDNYDSFVHNLARLVRLAGAETNVLRNDAIDPRGIERLQPDGIVLSPGPGAPREAGCCLEIVRYFATRTPLLGVCLGHQALVEGLGGAVGRAPEPLHGHTSVVSHRGEGLFAGIPSPMTACRYHSLAAEERHLPDELSVTARAEDGVIMAVQHRTRPLFGVQFHPEAILTEHGHQIVGNFVGQTRQTSA